MPYISNREYIHHLRAVRQAKLVSIVLAVGIGIGTVVGLVAGSGLGVFRTSFFDAYQPPTGDERIIHSEKEKEEAKKWEAAAKEAERRAANAERALAESNAATKGEVRPDKKR
jgi:hypothetical protein